jgi:hypothetical protein
MPNANTAVGFQNAEPTNKTWVDGPGGSRRFGGLSGGDSVLDVGCGTGSLQLTLPEIATLRTSRAAFDGTTRDARGSRDPHGGRAKHQGI